MSEKNKNETPLRYLASLILFVDLLAATAVWHFRVTLFGGAGQADLMGGAVALTLVLGALIAFAALSRKFRKTL